MTEYLVRKHERMGTKPNRIHLWDGFDTVCKLASTGGLRIKKYEVVTENKNGYEVCLMCRINAQKLEAFSGV